MRRLSPRLLAEHPARHMNEANLPTVQLMHAVVDERSASTRPAVHAVHAVAPEPLSVSVVPPARHALHSLAPMDGAEVYRPGGQRRHAVRPKLPAEQLRPVGAALGASVGVAVGAVVGADVGLAVGAAVGAPVGVSVGDAVRLHVWPLKFPAQPATHT